MQLPLPHHRFPALCHNGIFPHCPGSYIMFIVIDYIIHRIDSSLTWISPRPATEKKMAKGVRQLLWLNLATLYLIWYRILPNKMASVLLYLHPIFQLTSYKHLSKVVSIVESWFRWTPKKHAEMRPGRFSCVMWWLIGVRLVLPRSWPKFSKKLNCDSKKIS